MRQLQDTIYAQFTPTQMEAAQKLMTAMRIAIYKWKRPLDRLRELYDDIDNDIKEANIYEESKCKKGCSFCCNINVDISTLEAALLVPYVRKQDRQQMEKQKGLSFEQFLQLPYADRKCIFLEDGKCRAYNDRPLNCRTHFVHSDPANCDTEDGDKETAVMASGIISIKRDSFHSVYVNNGNIATQLLKL